MAFPILAVIPVVAKLLDKLIPDPAERARLQLETMRMAQSGELAYLEADVNLALAQIDVNKEDAKGQSWAQRNWRPAAAWGCVLVGVFYPAVRVLTPWVLTVSGVQGVPPLPPLDGTEAMTMLFGLLGLGGMRMAERIKGKV